MDNKSFLKGLITGFISMLLISALVFIGVFVIKRNSSVKFSKDITRRFNEVNKLIDEKFLFDTNDSKMEEMALKGYVAGLNDKYTVYYTADEYKEISQGTAGTFVGIGVYIAKDPETGGIYISDVFDGGSAKEMGITPGDVIVAVDKTRITEENYKAMSDAIAGEEGTTVSLTILRDGKEFDVEVVRRVLEKNYVIYDLYEENIAYIGISHFTNAAIGQFMEAVDKMNEDGAKAVIFDVRGNTGGTLQAVTNMVDYLLPAGLIMYTEDKAGNQKQYRTSNQNANLKIPAVVLTDANSASASEVFSGALKDRGAAKTVGKKTFGKGIVQSIYALDNGTALKLTVERYFTPNGNCIHEIGIEPDLEVELDVDLLQKEGIDTQLEAAVELLDK